MLASTGRRIERSDKIIAWFRGSSSRPYFENVTSHVGCGTSPYETPKVEIHPGYYIDSALTTAHTMAVKLSSRQQAQLAYLQTLPPKFQRIYAVIEEMSALRADDVVVRGLARLLDEIKGNASSLSLTGVASTAGLMGTMARRGGGLQMKVRGLRELLGSLKINYEAAMRSATTPEAPKPDEA